MATQLTIFADSEITMRYKQPFLTQALNEKQAVNTPPGTYRGFRLGPNGANNTVTLSADPVALDHVVVYQTTAGSSITLRKTGGDLSLNLGALVDVVEKTWVLAVYASYTIGAATTAEIRAYELDPTDEFTIAVEVAELVVLGTVIIPASSVAALPAANITLNKRSYAWKNRAIEDTEWYPLLRNGSFDFSQDDSLNDFKHSSAYWERGVTSGDGSWRTDQSDPRTGSKGLAWVHAAASSSAFASQPVNIAVIPGQALRYKFYKKALKVSTGGTATLGFTWRNTVGGSATGTTISIDLSGVDAAYVEVEGTVLVPAGVGYLSSIGFNNIGLNFGSAGDAYLLDDVNVWMEGQGEDHLYGEGSIRLQEATKLVLHRPDDPTGFLSAASAVVEYDVNTGMENQVVGSVLIRGHRYDAVPAAPSPSIYQVASTQAGDEYTLIRETAPSGEKAHREYVSPTGAFLRTTNAKWDNTTNLWTKDANGDAAGRADFNTDGSLSVYSQAAGVNSWADGAWTSTNLVLSAAGELTVPSVVSTSHTTGTMTSSGLITNTAGGILFPTAGAEAGGSTLLDIFEVGSWTPTVSVNAVGQTVTSSATHYVRIGERIAIVYLEVQWTQAATVSDTFITIGGWPSGLPTQGSVRPNLLPVIYMSQGLGTESERSDARLEISDGLAGSLVTGPTDGDTSNVWDLTAGNPYAIQVSGIILSAN